jgi:hypothetical protein
MNQQLAKFDNAGRDIIEDRRNEVTLHNFTEICQFADRASKTRMVPSHYMGKPDDIVVCVMQGIELGLNPLQSLSSIAVVNGKPSLYGDAPLALCYKSGKVESFKETIQGEGEDMVATCTVKRVGQQAVSESFSVEDAKNAGLWQKAGPWKQYPKRMLTFRARGFALRNAFPDVLLGIGIKEEVIDVPAPKNITPSDDDIMEPKKGVEGVKEKLKRKKAEEVEDNRAKYVDEIKSAKTERDLEAIAVKISKLSDDDQAAIREDYRAKLTDLREESQKVIEAFVSEIANGAPKDAAMDFYADQIAGMSDKMRAEFDKRVAEITADA